MTVIRRQRGQAKGHCNYLILENPVARILVETWVLGRFGQGIFLGSRGR